jgi:hypothetical protein
MGEDSFFWREYGQGTGGIIEGKEKDPPAFGEGMMG